MDPSNPYESPSAAGGPPGGGDPREAQEKLNVPSILLIATGAIGILFALMGMASGGQSVPPELLENPDLAQFRGLIEASSKFGVIGNILSLAVNGLVVFGALKMRKLEGYGLAMASAIIAIVPCFGCCCLGMPVGIWALVVLLKPEVKAAFR